MKDVIPAGEFKTHCLKIMEEVAKKRIPVMITKRGEPIAKLIPIEEKFDKELSVFGFMKNTVTIKGDIISPIDEKWEVDFDS